MSICAITGVLKSLDGTSLTNTQLLFERRGVVKDGLDTVIPRRVTVTSDMYGNVSFSLYSGTYVGHAVGIKGMEKFLVSVPDLTPEARLEDLLGEGIENVSNDLLTRIVNIRNELINIYQQTEVLISTVDMAAIEAQIAEMAAQNQAAQDTLAQADAYFSLADRGIIADNITALEVDLLLTYAAGSETSVVAGDIINTRLECHSYVVAAQDAVTYDLITAGGVKLLNGQVFDGLGIGGATGNLGVNQDWQNMTMSRSNGVGDVYQNASGGPIFVYIYPGGTEASPDLLFQVSLNGVDSWMTIGRAGMGRHEVNTVVPNGYYYRANGGHIGTWMELRPLP